MADPVQVTLVGEGGGEWEFDLPLSEPFADQVKGGKLRPKSDDDIAKLTEAGLLGEPQADDPSGSVPSLEDRIDAVSSHAEANALAVELGVDGFTDKKPSLDEKRAALLAKANEQQ